mgnify:CR=1 FL=1
MRKHPLILTFLLFISSWTWSQSLVLSSTTGSDFFEGRAISTYESIPTVVNNGSEIFLESISFNQYFHVGIQLPSLDAKLELKNKIHIESSLSLNKYWGTLYQSAKDGDFVSALNSASWAVPDEDNDGLYDYNRHLFRVGSFSATNLSFGAGYNLFNYRKLRFVVNAGLRHTFKFYNLKEPIGDDAFNASKADFVNKHIANWKGLTCLYAGFSIDRGSFGMHFKYGRSLYNPEVSDAPFFKAAYFSQFGLSFKFLQKPLKRLKKISSNEYLVKDKSKGRFNIGLGINLYTDAKFSGEYISSYILGDWTSQYTEISIYNKKPKLTNLPYLQIEYEFSPFRKVKFLSFLRLSHLNLSYESANVDMLYENYGQSGLSYSRSQALYSVVQTGASIKWNAIKKKNIIGFIKLSPIVNFFLNGNLDDLNGKLPVRKFNVSNEIGLGIQLSDFAIEFLYNYSYLDLYEQSSIALSGLNSASIKLSYPIFEL